MKKNGYFTPNAENRHTVFETHLWVKNVKEHYNLKPKRRFKKLDRLLFHELKSQIRNSIQY